MHAVNYSSIKVLHHYIFKVHILKKIKIMHTKRNMSVDEVQLLDYIFRTSALDGKRQGE